MAQQNNKAKHWCFTINNPTQLDHASLVLFRQSCTYLVYGNERGGLADTPHIQGYFCLSGQKTRTQLSKILERAHLEVKRGTVRDAIDYCKKGDQSHDEWTKFKTLGPTYGVNADVTVHGIEPLEQNEAGHKASMEKYQETMEKAKAGNFDEINPKHALLYFNNIRNVRQEVINKKPREVLNWPHGQPPNIWYYGPTGTGKSKRIWEEFPDAYRKMCNKWWDEYNDQDVVVLEDIGLTHEYLGDHLKIWADRFPFRAEMKGRTCMLRPQRIVVSSNYHPNELWKDPNVVNPILRRFEVKELVPLKPVDDTPPPRPKKTKASKHHSEERPSKRKPPLYRQNAQGRIVPNLNPTNQRELLFGPGDKGHKITVDLTLSNSEESSGVAKSWESESESSGPINVLEHSESIEEIVPEEMLISWCKKCEKRFLDCPCKY